MTLMVQFIYLQRYMSYKQRRLARYDEQVGTCAYSPTHLYKHTRAHEHTRTHARTHTHTHTESRLRRTHARVSERC